MNFNRGGWFAQNKIRKEKVPTGCCLHPKWESARKKKKKQRTLESLNRWVIAISEESNSSHERKKKKRIVSFLCAKVREASYITKEEIDSLSCKESKALCACPKGAEKGKQPGANVTRSGRRSAHHEK